MELQYAGNVISLDHVLSLDLVFVIILNEEWRKDFVRENSTYL